MAESASMTVLNTLLLNYFLVLLVNATLSVFCIYYYKDTLYKYSLGIWLGTAANIVLHGMLQQNSLTITLAFSTYFLIFVGQIKILALVTRFQFPLVKYAVLTGLSVACSAVVYALGGSFTWVALPAAVGTSASMIDASWKAVRRSSKTPNSGGTKIFCGILFLHALHQLDFPFLRANPSYAVLGFSVALVLTIGFSIFLPSYITKEISDRYSESLLKLNEKLLSYQNQLTDAVSFASLGEMSYSFVHDMATPTNILVMYAAQLSKELKGENSAVDTRNKALKYVQTIEMATERLYKMQNLFRSIAKTKGSSKVVTADLLAVAKECADLCEPLVGASGIQIEVSCKEAAVPLEVFEGSLETILLNLLQNAINALTLLPKEKPKKVTIGIGRAPGKVSLDIGDTGEGIPQGRLEKLWERRGQSGGSPSIRPGDPGSSPSAFKGTGYGLYSIKNAVDRMGGRIEVATGPSGTTFSIELREKLGKQAG